MLVGRWVDDVISLFSVCVVQVLDDDDDDDDDDEFSVGRCCAGAG